MTEVGRLVACQEHLSLNIESPLDSAGVVQPVTTIRVADFESGEALPPWTRGQVIVYCPAKFKYYKNETATKEAMTHDG